MMSPGFGARWREHFLRRLGGSQASLGLGCVQSRPYLKPGVAVFVIALKHEDGKLTSARLYAEKDGIKPPMCCPRAGCREIRMSGSVTPTRAQR
jgi:hypothetical protein